MTPDEFVNDYSILHLSEKEKERHHLAANLILSSEKSRPPTDPALLHMFVIDTNIVVLLSHNLGQSSPT